MEKKEDFYSKLKKSLDETTKFPSEYLFKFIIPNDKNKLKQIEDIFNYGGAVINTRPSKTGKYVSISINIEMKSSSHIIEKYKEVGQVEGVISL